MDYVRSNQQDLSATVITLLHVTLLCLHQLRTFLRYLGVRVLAWRLPRLPPPTTTTTSVCCRAPTMTTATASSAGSSTTMSSSISAASNVGSTLQTSVAVISSMSARMDAMESAITAQAAAPPVASPPPVPAPPVPAPPVTVPSLSLQPGITALPGPAPNMHTPSPPHVPAFQHQPPPTPGLPQLQQQHGHVFQAANQGSSSKAIAARVSHELAVLNGSSSDSDDPHPQSTRKSSSKKLKSGRSRTSEDVVKRQVDWPHFSAFKGVARSAAEYDSLTIPEFVYGYLGNLLKSDVSHHTQLSMLKHLRELMHATTMFPWEGVRTYHGIVLRLMEHAELRAQYARNTPSFLHNMPEIQGQPSADHHPTPGPHAHALAHAHALNFKKGRTHRQMIMSCPREAVWRTSAGGATECAWSNSNTLRGTATPSKNGLQKTTEWSRTANFHWYPLFT